MSQQTTYKEPKELKDLERFLAGDGTISRRKVRKSLGSRRSRKQGTKAVKTRKQSTSSAVKVSERFTAVKHKLEARKRQQAENAQD